MPRSRGAGGAAPKPLHRTLPSSQRSAALTIYYQVTAYYSVEDVEDEPLPCQKAPPLSSYVPAGAPLPAHPMACIPGGCKAPPKVYVSAGGRAHGVIMASRTAAGRRGRGVRQLT